MFILFSHPLPGFEPESSWWEADGLPLDHSASVKTRNFVSARIWWKILLKQTWSKGVVSSSLFWSFSLSFLFIFIKLSMSVTFTAFYFWRHRCWKKFQWRFNVNFHWAGLSFPCSLSKNPTFSKDSFWVDPPLQSVTTKNIEAHKKIIYIMV